MSKISLKSPSHLPTATTISRVGPNLLMIRLRDIGSVIADGELGVARGSGPGAEPGSRVLVCYAEVEGGTGKLQVWFSHVEQVNYRSTTPVTLPADLTPMLASQLYLQVGACLLAHLVHPTVLPWADRAQMGREPLKVFDTKAVAQPTGQLGLGAGMGTAPLYTADELAAMEIGGGE